MKSDITSVNLETYDTSLYKKKVIYRKISKKKWILHNKLLYNFSFSYKKTTKQDNIQNKIVLQWRHCGCASFTSKEDRRF